MNGAGPTTVRTLKSNPRRYRAGDTVLWALDFPEPSRLGFGAKWVSAIAAAGLKPNLFALGFRGVLQILDYLRKT